MTEDEKTLLRWLADEECKYGECYGPALFGLIARGFAQIHDDGNILFYQSVSLTDAGKEMLESLQ